MSRFTPFLVALLLGPLVAVPARSQAEGAAPVTPARPTAAAAAPTGVRWLEGGLDAAMAYAEATGRVVLVYVSGPWCPACRTLETGAFQDPRVADAVARDFVAIRIDGQSGEGPKLVERYHVVATPTLLFLTPDGEEVDRLFEQVAPRRLLRALSDYRDGEGDLERLARRASTHPMDLDLAFEVGRRYAARGDAIAAKRHFARIFAARRLLSAAPSAPARGAADVSRLGSASDFHAVRPQVEADMAGALEHVEGLMAGAYLALGRYLYLRGQRDPAAAVDILEELRRRFPDSPEAAETPYHLALAHQRAGRPAQATRELRRILAPDPTNPRAAAAVARFCLEAGAQAEWGSEQAEAALAAHPDVAELWGLLAELRFRQGDPAGAVAAAERVVALGSEPGPAQVRLARYREAAARALAEQQATEAAGPEPSSENAPERLPASHPAASEQAPPGAAEAPAPATDDDVA